MLNLNFQINTGNKIELSADVYRSLERFRAHLKTQALAHTDFPRIWTHYDLWAKSLYISFQELETSFQMCVQHSRKVRAAIEEEMDADELMHYRSFLYFYKDAFIRIFSVLDKNGHFLNRYFGLQTEAVKERYSFYTVLRRLRILQWHKELTEPLAACKEAYREPLQRLRRQRNTEVHCTNMEFADDATNAEYFSESKSPIESPEQGVRDAQQGFDMVCKATVLIFDYSRTHFDESRKTGVTTC